MICGRKVEGNRKNPEPSGPGFLSDQLLSLVDGDLLAVLAHTLKTNSAVHLGEQSIVAAAANVHTGVNMGTALTNQNVAGQNVLTISTLGAQTLALGITAVLGGTNALLVGEELKTDVHHGKFHPFCKMMRGQET